jgi:hypothetical protein
VWGDILPLDAHHQSFRRGAVDTFHLAKAKELGPLAKIKIGHDGKGRSPGNCPG